MKKKVLSVLLALVLVLSFGLVTAAPVAAVDEWVTIVLENKNPADWQVIPDETQATLKYNTSYPIFWCDFRATGLEPDTSYALIYYADTEDRYVDWGGDNPGAVIAGFIANAEGGRSVQWKKELNMNLPCPPDANGYFYDYTKEPDLYRHATGAKVWVVPMDCLTDNATLPVVKWQPDRFLFETELIQYTDTGVPPYSEVWVDDDWAGLQPWDSVGGHTFGYDAFAVIQDGIDNVGLGGTVNVAAGTYDEQVVITHSLTLQGAGDTTIIQPPAVELTATSDIPWIGGGTGTMAAIVSVETTGGTVIIKDLKIDGSLIPSKVTTWVGGLVYLETSGKVEGVTVIGNSALPDRTAGIFAAAITESASLEITGCTVIGYNRAGIYALGEKFTADYHHNEINGPGEISTGVPNGMFFLRGATGSATYNTITDLGYTGVGEYRSTGIGTYNAGVDVLFSNNEISLVQNAFALSTDTSGTIVEYNNVHDCHTGVRIEARAINSIIQYNDIHDNDFAIRCGATMGEGNQAHFNNFVNNPGLEWTNVEEAEPNTYIGAVCNVHPTFILDATNNWWGNASGPSHSPGEGDPVSDNVLYDPWLLEPLLPGEPLPTTFQTTLPLKIGWTLVSVDNWINPASAVGEGVVLAYSYTPGGGYTEVTPATLVPVDALYLKTEIGGGVGFDYLGGAPVASSKDLVAGWNLISSATEWNARAILSPLRYIDVGEQQGVGMTTLVSQGYYNQYSPDYYLSTISPADWGDSGLNGYGPNLLGVTLYPFDGYWVYMNGPKNFGVIPGVQPIPYPK